MSANKAIFAIDNLEDLREAQNALNARFRELQRRMAVSFRVGETVKFKSRAGKTITGTVQKINQKTVKVQSSTGNMWTVTASLLQKV